MAELTQDTAHSHNGIPIKSLESKCSKVITELPHAELQKATQNESCLPTAHNGMVGRTAPDFLWRQGGKKGANDSERNHRPPGPWRRHLQKETITPTQQPPEELGWQGRRGIVPMRKVTVVII